MPTIVTDDGEIVSDFPLATIQIKNSLDDTSWTNTTFLWCDKLTRAANGYDEAELTRYIGDMIQPGSDSFAEYEPLSILGKYVKVTIPQESPLLPIEWVGVIVGTAKKRSAVGGAAPGEQYLTGKQQGLRAVGLEYFLDRVQIDGSVVDETTIKRVIPFNGGQGVSLDADTRTRENRSDNAVTVALDDDTDVDVYNFAKADETGELWTLKQIIQYVLAYFASRNQAGAIKPTIFVLDEADITAGVLDGIAPTLNPDGMTPFQVLNTLLSPQRGYVWWLEYDEIFEHNYRARIRVETIALATVSLPSLGTIPANRDQQTLDFDRQRDVDDVTVAEMGSRIYHQVIVRGARMTSTCTLGNVDSESIVELVHDWADTPEDMQAGYNIAALGVAISPEQIAEYDALTEAEKKERNDAFRQDEKWYRVYSAFRASPDWDGKSGDGAAGSRNWSFPVLSPNGSILGGETFSVNGLRLLNYTKLKRGWDYTNASSPVQTSPAGSEAEYMPTAAMFKVSAGVTEGEEDKYQFADKMNHSDFKVGTKVSDKINTTYFVHIQQTVPGILLNASGHNHACALNHWSGAEPSKGEPEVDYETLRVTCTLEADTYCEARHPADVDMPADTPLQKLLLYVGDGYRLDFLAANTVVALTNGEPVLTNGGRLRDDRARIKDIARVAYEWYQVNRRPLTVNFKQIRNVWRLGMLITSIGTGTTAEQINTVVSMITYDCEHGRTTIQTHDAQLDLVKVT